jgi:heme/copper-type cytochrome/quinol oxidase subunit 2
MRRLHVSRGSLNLLWLVLLILVWVFPLPSTATTDVHTLNMNLSQFEFAPGRVEVHQGDQVIINLTASDVVHGFYLDGYGVEQRVEPAITRQISFTADQTGKFRYRCSVSCGSLHPFMIGELVVSTNFPFLRSLGLLAVSLFATLTSLYFGARKL